MSSRKISRFSCANCEYNRVFECLLGAYSYTNTHTSDGSGYENARKQVWDTILKREAAAVGRIHVCDACADPCDDPEDQMVVPYL